jgi:hypothetical protein
MNLSMLNRVFPACCVASLLLTTNAFAAFTPVQSTMVYDTALEFSEAELVVAKFDDQHGSRRLKAIHLDYSTEPYTDIALSANNLSPTNIRLSLDWRMTLSAGSYGELLELGAQTFNYDVTLPATDGEPASGFNNVLNLNIPFYFTGQRLLTKQALLDLFTGSGNLTTVVNLTTQLQVFSGQFFGYNQGYSRGTVFANWQYEYENVAAAVAAPATLTLFSIAGAAMVLRRRRQRV